MCVAALCEVKIPDVASGVWKQGRELVMGLQQHLHKQPMPQVMAVTMIRENSCLCM